MKTAQGLVLACLCALLAACASVPEDPNGCLPRMKKFAQALEPGFAALGYTFSYSIALEENLYSNWGFPSPPQVMGDAVSSGRIRLRPSRVCGDDRLGFAVVAHEMAHVALRHYNSETTGITLEWAPAKEELEADDLGLRALRKIGASPRVWKLLECRLGQCGEGRLGPPRLRPPG